MHDHDSLINVLKLDSVVTVKEAAVATAVEEPASGASTNSKCEPVVQGSSVVRVCVGEMFMDGLYCSATGMWRQYQLISETGLVSAVEDNVALIKFKSGSVRRVKRHLLMEFDAELVGRKVDRGVWERLRPGEAVKEATSAREKREQLAEAERLSEREAGLQKLYVRWSMLVGLGLLNEDLDEEAVEERMKCKKKWELWVGEYQR